MAEWLYQQCTGCDVRWHGSQRPCWCCGGPGTPVPPEVYVGYMRWDPDREAM